MAHPDPDAERLLKKLRARGWKVVPSGSNYLLTCKKGTLSVKIIGRAGRTKTGLTAKGQIQAFTRIHSVRHPFE